MARKKTTAKSGQPVPFETSLESLKLIVSELETGNLSLSDSLEKYEQGISFLKHCHDALESAQKRIEILVDLDEDGNWITREFDGAATLDSKGTGGRRTRDDYFDGDDDDSDLDADDIDGQDELF